MFLPHTMQIFYETVLYKSGIINVNNIPGFATINYDKEPSPLTVFEEMKWANARMSEL